MVTRSNAHAARLRSRRRSCVSCWAACAVANVGVELFADELERQGVEVERVDWRPPAEGDDALRRLAAEAAAIARANDEAVARLDAAQPMLVGVGRRARPAARACTERTLLHAGPPIEWADMSGPLRGAIVGAALYEGLASDHEQAERMAAAGDFEFGPCHERGAVGPMAGVVSAVDADVHRRERHARQPRVLHVQRGARQGPALRRQRRGGARAPGLDPRRARARVLPRARAPGRARRPARDDRPGAADGRRGPQPQPRRHVAAAARAAAGAGRARRADGRRRRGRALRRRQRPLLPQPDDAGVQGGGRRGGGRRALLDRDDDGAQRHRVRRAPQRHRRPLVHGPERDDRRPLPAGLRGRGRQPRHRRHDDHRDRRPRRLLDGRRAGDRALRRRPRRGRHRRHRGDVRDHLEREPAYQIPALGFRGTPLGIDCREVVPHGVLPFVNTGIAHREPGVGQIGAGLVKPPMEAFVAAARGLAG